jgi:hypothetical protein
MCRAKLVVARKLAVVLLGMWRDGTEFRWGTRRLWCKNLNLDKALTKAPPFHAISQ